MNQLVVATGFALIVGKLIGDYFGRLGLQLCKGRFNYFFNACGQNHNWYVLLSGKL
jgi:hypothetical protein